MKSLAAPETKEMDRKRLDPLSKQQRSKRMARIRPRDTQPELALRKLVFSLGYRYRLHDDRLPGKPDLVFRSRKRVIFMHGCFWHQHGCKHYRLPTSRAWFWSSKLAGNVLRDVEILRTLRRQGWRVLVVWECELRKNPLKLAWKLVGFLQ